MEEYRENGTALGWLLSCDDETAYIFRAGQADYENVQGFERQLSREEVLVGFVLNLRKLQLRWSCRNKFRTELGEFRTIAQTPLTP